jgi:hypothetical protein
MKSISLIIGVFAILGSCKKTTITSQSTNVNQNSNSCSDTINVSYSKQIQPILNTNCVRCHDAETGQNLTTYQTTLPFAKAGIIEGCITGKPDFILMPPANKMDSCTIQTIQAWIRQGMKDN